MSHDLRAIVVDKWDELMTWQKPWEDLWRKTEISSPLVLLPHVWLYWQAFAPRRRLRAVLIHDAEGTLHGAVVVIADGGRTGMPVYGLPNNDWADTGAVLFDPHSRDQDGLQKLLLDALRTTGAAIVDLGGVRSDQGVIPDPNAISCVRGRRSPVRRLFQTGLIGVDQTLEQVEGRWSKNLRKNLRRRRRALADLGDLSFNVKICSDRKQALAAFAEGIELESRGWKGRQGTAMAHDPAILSYYTGQVDQLWSDGHLRQFELRLNDHLIAFEYGWMAKGVYHSNKTTYDETFGKYSPGQLLFTEVIKHFTRLDSCQTVDLQGEIGSASEALRPEIVDVVNCSLYLSASARMTYGLIDGLRASLALRTSRALAINVVQAVVSRFPLNV